MHKKKKLLVLNGSHSDIPLISAAKTLGFYVITTGNNSELLGHVYADEYHSADFSNPEAVLELAIKLKIDAVCACSNDFGAISASYIAEKMHLPGHDSYETTLLLHHKDKFKNFALQNNILTPFAESYSSIEDAENAIRRYRFPLIIKPIDLTGGKGVKTVKSVDEYNKAISHAFSTSRLKRIVIEDFIEGPQHSFSSFIVNGKVKFYFSDNEYSFLNPYLVSTSAAPATKVEIVANTLTTTIEHIAKLLLLKDGIFHIQYIFNNNKAYILEITRRCSGDFYPYPVNKSTGLCWEEWIVKSEAGIDCSDFPITNQKGFCGRHCIMGSKNGLIKSIYISPIIEDNIYYKFIWGKQGDYINNYLIDKIGVVFFTFNSRSEMIEKVEMINKLIYIEIE